MIKLGDIAKDSITGYEGVVVAETNWLHGCRRLTLQSRHLHDGKPIETQTFDEPQVELVSDGPLTPILAGGGPRPEPIRR